MSTILVVDDQQSVRDTLTDTLENHGYAVRTAANLAEAAEAVKANDLDAVLLDLNLGAEQGAHFLDAHKGLLDELPVIVLTGQGGTQTAIETMRRGAYDFVVKPGGDVLLLRLARAVEKRRLCLAAKRAEAAPLAPHERIVGQSQAIADVGVRVAQLSNSLVRVLIRGEPGTGKELVARTLYEHSPRKDATFVAFSAANLVETLAESELFGHARGAFHGATQDRGGLVELAHGGTLFIDEVGELPASIQARLLRWSQEGEFHRVGDNTLRKSDARIITATNRDLEKAIRDGTFRRDLYDRLNVATITLPPLRERLADVPLLANHFLQEAGRLYGKPGLSFHHDALGWLGRQRWPGNVRELENVVHRAVLTSWGQFLTASDVEDALRLEAREGKESEALPSPVDASVDSRVRRSLEEVEKEHIAAVLAHTKRKQTAAAKILGIDRKTLSAKIVRYGLRSSE